MERALCYAKIEWKILDFNRFMNLKKCVIESPLFVVPVIQDSRDYSWKLYLKIVEKSKRSIYFPQMKKQFSLQVEGRKNKDFGELFLFSKLSIECLNEKISGELNDILYFKDGVAVLEMKDACMDLPCPKYVSGDVCITVNVELWLYEDNADNGESNYNSNKFENLLSADMRSLYDLKSMSDVKIEIGYKTLEVHKAVLAARSKYFARMFCKNARNTACIDFDVLDIDYNVMKEIVLYLYTGKFSTFFKGFLLEEIKKWIEVFEIEDMKWFVTPIEFSAVSKIRTEEVVIEIKDLEYPLNHKKFPISSDWVLEIEKFSRKLLHIHIYFLGDFFSSFEVACSILLEENGRNLAATERRELMQKTTRSFPIHVSLSPIVLIRANLTIQLCYPKDISLKINKCALDSRYLTLITANLSNDLKAILRSGDFSDVVLIAGNNEFKVHKCILAARSHRFAEMFIKGVKTNKLTIQDINPLSLKPMLDFIYTDETKSCLHTNEILELFYVGKNYSILKMEKQYLELLKMNFKTHVFEILVYADTNDDKSLREAAIAFIWRNRKDIVLSEEWKKFKTEQSCLADEINNEFTSREEYVEEKFWY